MRYWPYWLISVILTGIFTGIMWQFAHWYSALSMGLMALLGFSAMIWRWQREDRQIDDLLERRKAYNSKRKP